MIEVSQLRKVYGSPPHGVVAVDGVSFSVAPGELFVIMGLSGSGKSTELAGWLSKFTLTSDQLGSLELLMQERGQGNEQQAAKEWIEQNRQLVDSWLS